MLSFKSTWRLLLLLCMGGVSCFAQLQISSNTQGSGPIQLPLAQDFSNNIPIFASGGNSPYTWTKISGALPPGITLNSNDAGTGASGTGAFLGAPTQLGSFQFTLRVTDTSGATASQSFTAEVVYCLNVAGAGNCATGTAQLSGAGIGPASAYSVSFSVVGGTAPYTLSYVPGLGQLPPGISFPTTDSASQNPFVGKFTALGDFTFTLQATDSAGLVTQQSFSLPVLPFSITPSGSPAAALGPGLLYNQVTSSSSSQVGVLNGTAPYTWKLLSGSLPPGVGLNPQTDGSAVPYALYSLPLTGGAPNETGPTTPGTYSFTLGVTDANGLSAQQAFTFIIQPFAVPSDVLPGGIVGQSYNGGSNYPLPINGGLSPFAYNPVPVSGQLPPGLSIDPQLGLLGTPTAAGTYSFTIEYSDSSPAPYTLSNSQSFVISVAATSSQPDPNSNSFNGGFAIAGGIVSGPNNKLYFTETAPISQDVNSNSLYGIAWVDTHFIFDGPNNTGPYTFLGIPYLITALVSPDGSSGSLWYGLTGIGLGRTTTSDGKSIQIPFTSLVNAPTPLAPVVGGLTPYTSKTTGLSSIWFTVYASGTDSNNKPVYYAALGKVDPTAANPTPTFYPLPNEQSAPGGIVVGPDQALWFTDYVNGTQYVGRFNPETGNLSPPACPGLDANLQECSVASGQLVAGAITVGPDGALWFASGTNVGRLTPDGLTNNSFPTPLSPISTAQESPMDMVAGPDGAVWFTTSQFDLGRITSSGVISIVPLGVATHLAFGPDGALWYTGGGAIGRLVPPLALSCPSTVSAESGTALGSVSCAAIGGTGPFTYSVTGTLPPGVQFNTTTGTLSGSPQLPAGQGQTFTFTINATDSTGQNASQQFTFTVTPRPPVTLTCDFSKQAQVGAAYSAGCVGGGGLPPLTFSVVPANGLPPGLTLNTATGAVTGTPAARTFGSYSFSIVATDSGVPALTATQAATLTVIPAPLVLTCSLPQAEQGVLYYGHCNTTGGIGQYTFLITSGVLPAGLTFNADGSITGSPAAAGKTAFTLTVQDPGPPFQSSSQNVTLTVIPPHLGLRCDFSQLGKVNSPYATACLVTNGTQPYKYSVTGTPPKGLAVDASGHIAFTPSAPGTFNFSVQVTDSEATAQTATQTVKLPVNPVQLTITSTSLPNGSAGLPYSASPLSAGGTPPYSWTTDPATLPPGVSLVQDAQSSAWVLSGTPSAAGTYSFTLQVKDSAKTAAQASQAFSVTISGALEPEFTEYALPTASGIDSLVTGPDGAVWFTTLDQPAGNLLGRAAGDGTIATFPSPNALAPTPSGSNLTVGPDGFLWFTETDTNRIGQVSPQIVTDPAALSLDFQVPLAGSGAQGIIAGPDGNLWYTEATSNNIGRLTTSGLVLNEFHQGLTANSAPAAIALGSDNALWFTESKANQIGRITTAGSITEFKSLTAAGAPAGITLGPDGALWFVEKAASKIGRIAIDGTVAEWATGTPASGPAQIVTGPDGALYFTETTANQLGRITVDGQVTEYKPTGGLNGPLGLTLAPDGSLWIGENGSNKLARFQLVPAVQLSCTFESSGPDTRAGLAYSGSCVASNGLPPYTFTLTGTPPPGLSIDPASGVLSGTVNLPGTFSFGVQVIDSSDPPQTVSQASAPFTVLPGPLSIACSAFAPGTLNIPYSSSCSAMGGTPPYSYSVVPGGTLPTGLALDPTSGVVSGTPTVLGSYSFSVQAADSGAQTAVGPVLTVPIQLGQTGPGGNPLFAITNLPTNQVPDTTISGASVQLTQAFAVPVTASVQLTFTPDSGLASFPNADVPSGYVEPAIQFVDSSGKKLGTTYNFTIAPGQTSISLPAINPGTVIGSLAVTVSTPGLQQAESVVAISRALIIQPASVQMTNITATGFDVELVGLSSIRYLEYANFAFNAAPGKSLQGETSFSIDLRQVMLNWFISNPGLQYGGAFSLTVPFTLSGPSDAISSVTVTLFNDDGVGDLTNPANLFKSQPVTGTP